MANLKFKRGAVAGLPAGAAGEPLFTTDQFRLYVGSTGGNRLVGLLDNIAGTVAPGVNDDAGDGYSVGSRWIDTVADKGYECADSTVGAAVWNQTSGAGVGSGTVTSVTGGTGLSGGVITTTGTLAFDPNSLTAADADLADYLAGYDTSGAVVRKFTLERILALQPTTPGGRLTLTTGTPVTSADVIAAGTYYYTPYHNNRVTLWDGTRWLNTVFPELGVIMAGYTNDLPYDIFLHLSAGSVAVHPLAWTSHTARATAITLQDGRYCKSGDKEKLYVGTIHTTGTATTEDSASKRYVWNMYNRVDRELIRQESADQWTYTTATLRPANNSTANRVSFVRGLDDDAMWCQVMQAINTNAAVVNVVAGIGLDSTTVNHAKLFGTNIVSASNVMQVSAYYAGRPGLGTHYLQWLEYSQASGTTTWYGDAGAPTGYQYGMIAEGKF